MTRDDLLQPPLHIRPGPRIITNLPRPLVEVLVAADYPGAEVDGRAAAEAPAAGVVDSLALQTRLFRGEIAPVHA